MPFTDALRVVVTSTCPQCRGLLALNRLDAVAYCAGCGRETPVADATWRELLREAIVAAPTMTRGMTRGSTASGVTLQYRRIGVECLTCGRPADLPSGRCAPCGTDFGARGPAGTSYASFLGEIAGMYGEAPGRGASAKDPLAQYPCEGCGASLRLEGNTQTIACTFCQRTTHVPLRFLYRGHRELPEPWALVFAEPLAAPGNATLAPHFDWGPIDGELPAVLTLGEGRVLIAGERRLARGARGASALHQDKRFLLVLEASGGAGAAGAVPRIVWTRSDLVLSSGSERRPQFLSPGSARILARTQAAVYSLDARTGDTATASTVDSPESDTFESWSLELPGMPARLRVRGQELRAMSRDDALAKELTARYRKVKCSERIYVGDGDHLLTVAVPDHPRRLVVRIVDRDGKVVAQGEQGVRNDEAGWNLERVSASMAAGRLWVAVSSEELFVAPVAPVADKLAFARVALPKSRVPAVIVAFGTGFAVVGNRGSFRAFDATGALAFDSATLPKPA